MIFKLCDLQVTSFRSGRENGPEKLSKLIYRCEHTNAGGWQDFSTIFLLVYKLVPHVAQEFFVSGSHTVVRLGQFTSNSDVDLVVG